MQGLLDGPRAALIDTLGSTATAREVVLSAIASRSPRVRHGITVLDADLAPTSDTLPVDWDSPGQVSYTYRPSAPDSGATAVTEVRRTCRLTLAGEVDDDVLLSNLFRVWTELQAPTGEWVRFHLITGLCTLPPRSDDGTVVRRQITIAPREHLFRARTLDDWQVVEAADDVLDTIRDDLADVFGITTSAFPVPAGASTLGEDMVFETGISYQAKWSRMLNGIGYDALTTTVDGLPTSQPLDILAARGPEWTYAPGDGRVVVPGSIEALSPELPNRLTFEARGPSLGSIPGNGLYILLNQSDGPASIDQRGWVLPRTIQAEAANQDELEAFGDAEAQRYFAGGGLRWTGQVGLNPLHDDRDVLEIVRPRLATTGVWNCTGWTYPLGRIAGEQSVLMSLSAELRVIPTEGV